MLEQTSPTIPINLAPYLAKKNEYRKAIFPVSEGDVTMIFPEDLSAEGLKELGLYLSIFLKESSNAG